MHNTIKTLKQHKFVEVVKIGKANAYMVNSNVFSKDVNRKKEKFAVFDATVVASMSEQDKKYQENWKGIKLKNVPIMKKDECLVDLNIGNFNYEGATSSNIHE